MKNDHNIISKSVTDAVIAYPFMAYAILRMPISPGPVSTMATNGRVIHYAQNWIDTIERREILGVIMHEVLHAVLLHPAELVDEKSHIERARKNVAMDYAVNSLLTAVNIALPPDALYDEKYNGLSWREIYDILPKNLTIPNPGDVIACRADEPQQKQMLTALAEITEAAARAGKNSAGLTREIKNITRVRVTLDSNLSAWARRTVGHADYAYLAVPHRRNLAGCILPQPVGHKIDIDIIIDTSGSVHDDELSRAIGVIRNIADLYRMNGRVYYVDSDIVGAQNLRDAIVKPAPKGGGGTSFRPYFALPHSAKKNAWIYITDGECDDFPDRAPDTPGLWLVFKNPQFRSPFGAIIHFKKEEK